MTNSPRVSKLIQAHTPIKILIVLATIVAIALVYGLIQVAGFLINDVLELSGVLKFVAQFSAVILSLFPVQIALALVVDKLLDTKKTQSH
ncbi:hypothetical protein MKY84_05335 [Chryseomicrobium sp. FSL W7-1435]|uniref:hypothetical protein n=1 Tax=Chryseomicrobium sp. FSL W7-1435 TaxID=2921704 RepID=UPI00315AFDDB